MEKAGFFLFPKTLDGLGLRRGTGRGMLGTWSAMVPEGTNERSIQMKKTAKALWLGFVALALAGVTTAWAAVPVQVGILGDTVQLFGADREVVGLKLNLPYAENNEVTGLDIGIAGGGGTIRGIRLNAINLSDVMSSGFEVGLVNIDAAAKGFQLGLVNIVKGQMDGFQLGLLNHVGSLHGLQIGLVNMIDTGNVKMLPIVSWSF